MSNLTFTQWLLGQHHREDDVGEFARAVAVDTAWPADQDSDLNALIRRVDPSDWCTDRAWNERSPMIRALIKARALFEIQAQ